MFFSKNIKSIFTRHYKTMLKIAKSSSIAHNPEFELLPAMYIVTDYAAASVGKDRQSISSQVIRIMHSLYEEFDEGLLAKRSSLYAEIIRGKQLRGDWLPEENSAIADNAITKCTVLLGDILSNPSLADSYDTAPIAIHGTFDLMNFNLSVMQPILNEMIQLFKEIYDL